MKKNVKLVVAVLIVVVVVVVAAKQLLLSRHLLWLCPFLSKYYIFSRSSLKKLYNLTNKLVF